MSTNFHRRFMAPAILAAAGIALAGCTATGTTPPEEQSGPGDYGTADGIVTVYSQIVGSEAEQLEASWADWEADNGIDIQYEGSKEFEAQISIRAQGGNAPDLAIIAQPGLLADLASRDFVQPSADGVKANVESGWSEDWANYASVDGTLYASPLMADVKGWIWYSPSEFATNGWEVPATYAELLTLTQTIRDAKGAAPWCAGFFSDAATGWPGTDWVEDVVLREAGTEVYDQWVSHEIPFADPAIEAAFDSVGEILLNPDYVNAGFGDVKSIVTTGYLDPARAVGDGTCSLHHQSAFFGDIVADPAQGNATVGPDGDVWAFMMPGSEAGSNTVTGGGDFLAAFANDADTVKVQEYLSSADWANSRVALGGKLSANKGVDPSLATSLINTEAVKVLQDPSTTFRFDASDLMPGVVGSGSFWSGIVDWINGKPTAEVLSTIDASWPSD